MKQLIYMLELQKELNDTTNGIGWENGFTNKGRPIDWKRCIYMECCELINSYSWKHWKDIDTSIDKENIKIEVVDIWHFLMSEILKTNAKNDALSLEDLAKKISLLENFDKLTEPASEIGNNYFEQIQIIEEFIKSLFLDDSIDILLNKFFLIVKQSGLNLDSLYSLYIGKNILNQFRQDNGYKDGTYNKIWNGKEDNVVMQEILLNEPDITPQHLYDKLTEVYQSLN